MTIEFRTLDAYQASKDTNNPLNVQKRFIEQKAKEKGIIPIGEQNTNKDKLIKHKAKMDLAKYSTAIADGKITKEEMSAMPKTYRNRASLFATETVVNAQERARDYLGVIGGGDYEKAYKSEVEEVIHNEQLNIADYEEYLDKN